LPRSRWVPPLWFGYHSDDLPNQKLWGLFSYPDAHEIPPVEFFPRSREGYFCKWPHPLIALARKQGLEQWSSSLLKGPASRVLTLQWVRSQLCRMLLLQICRYSYGVYPYSALHFRKWSGFRRFSSHRLRALSYP
jgi:hypothetical protein